MSITVCLAANTLYYPRGGGHRWVYLNWALGLRALGCQVVWLEEIEEGRGEAEARIGAEALARDLEPFGLSGSVAVCGRGADTAPALERASEADLLLSFRYGLSPALVGRFRRTALIDIDPGLLQIWIGGGQLSVAPHDVYLTTSEAVARSNGRIGDAGIAWRHVPPCVALEAWPVTPAAEGAAFTTISHWGTYDEWVWAEDGEDVYLNDKALGFEPFLDLPARTAQPLELALCLAGNQNGDLAALRERGWRVRHAQRACATAADYRRYVQRSLGEFSAAKPSCVRLQNAWVSDRTLCYLASGKPAVVEHTGPSALLPDREGLFRVRDAAEAARALEAIATDYERQCRLARALVEERFDARGAAARVLE
ncbi:MAG: hypothetical protein ACRDLO_08860, partial [Solirubrobacterales bacterium]